jgi:acetyl-CoA carboxylase biotin carboxyl carrier protein
MTQEQVWNQNGQAAQRAGEVGEACAVLEQVRSNAVRLLSEVGRTPRHLRIAAGEISIEIEWDTPSAASSAAQAHADVAEVPASSTGGVPNGAGYVTAPTVGVFYAAPEPGAKPFVRVGDRISCGQQVGIVEAMKLMIPVEADLAGTIVEVLTANGQSVEYGERLFALAADSE